MSTRLRSIFRSLLAIGLAILTGHRAAAQFENLATLNYSSPAINRVGNIQGVTWVIQVAGGTVVLIR